MKPYNKIIGFILMQYSDKYPALMNPYSFTDRAPAFRMRQIFDKAPLGNYSVPRKLEGVQSKGALVGFSPDWAQNYGNVRTCRGEWWDMGDTVLCSDFFGRNIHRKPSCIYQDRQISRR